jgi:hypothetical protein
MLADHDICACPGQSSSRTSRDRRRCAGSSPQTTWINAYLATGGGGYTGTINYSELCGGSYWCTRMVRTAWVAYLRNSGDGSNPLSGSISAAVMHGTSQSGRWAREFLQLGLLVSWVKTGEPPNTIIGTK